MFRDIVVNPELEKEVLESIPSGYTQIEKACYIYVKLCRTLNYSVDYYMGKPEAVEFFREPENIQKIDGKTNKDVVCYTFNAILLELLRKADLIDDVYCRGYEIGDDDKFVNKHLSFIGDVASFCHLRIEATTNEDERKKYDVDITRLKYSYAKPNGWTDNRAQKYIDAAMDKVLKDYPIEKTEAEKFIDILAARYLGKQKDYPLTERINIFIKSLSIAEYEMFGFHNLKTISQILFTNDELNYNKDRSSQDNVYYRTVKVKDAKELKAILACQTYDKVKQNSNLKIYEISLQDYNWVELTPEEYIARVDSEYYIKKHNEELQYPEIVNNYLLKNKMSF